MRFAVIQVRDFSLHALCRSEPGLLRKPLAITEGDGRHAVVIQSSLGTQTLVGLSPTLAMARCPGLILRTRDGAAEQEARRLLLATALTLSPRIEATDLGCCTVDLQGADSEQTEERVRECLVGLAKAGLPASIGVAKNALLAFYAARCTESVLIVDDARSFLEPLPLAFASPSIEQAEILHAWGIKTLGDLTALPKAEVGKRLGNEGVALWERAMGEATRVLDLVSPERYFETRWHYEAPLEFLEPLLFRLRRFAECLALELQGAGFVAERLTLTLFFEDDAPEHRREFRLAEPSVDLDGWLRILHAHLETLHTESRITAVRLVASPARPQVKQDGLFETGLRDPAAFWENLSRLASLVGDECVGTPVPADTHRPDSFLMEKPIPSVPPPELAPVHPPRGLVLRRFRPPWPARVLFGGDKPQSVESAQLRDTVSEARGPWFASGNWWIPEAWSVETWQVELSRGGIYQLARTNGGWCIEGVMD